MPLDLQIERQRFETAQYQAAYEAVGVAADMRRAFFTAVSTQFVSTLVLLQPVRLSFSLRQRS